MKPLITFDIDGTLARVPSMTQEAWQALYNAGAEKQFYATLDLACPGLPAFTKTLSQTHEIGIITARSMRRKEITTEWLTRQNITYNWLMVNLDGYERAPVLRRLRPVIHFDDNPEITSELAGVEVGRVWYNEWPSPHTDSKPWEHFYKRFALPEQLSLF